jgi:DNA-binding response OmpR family regulator
MLIARRDRSDLKTMLNNDYQLRNRRLLVMTDNTITAKLVGDAFAANAYEVLATEEIAKAVDFTITRNPGSILLMFSSLTATCDAARQIKPHTSAAIMGFSSTPVTDTERNAAIQAGCDDYRDAFSRSWSQL